MNNPAVDYNAIVTQKTQDGRIAAMETEIEKAGFVCLTHALSHYNYGGALMIERLQRDHADKLPTGEHRKWKIFVMRNEWGVVPKPGDKVVREIMRPLKDAAGRKLRSRAINDMKRRGTFKKKFVHVREFVVDDKGCIECTVDDAVWLLSQYGVNFEDTSAALCGRREMCSGQCKAPDGNLKHVWYWRYWEAPPWVYDKLPSLTAKKTRTRSTKKADQREQRKPEGTAPTVAATEEK